MTGKERKFWSLFILLNTIQFLPAYLINIDTSAFLPFASFKQHYWYEIESAFFKRNNYDIFRLSYDLVIFLITFYLLRKKIKTENFSIIAATYFLILFLFMIYFHLMYRIFLVQPVLFNDIGLLKLAFGNLGNGAVLIVIALLVVISALFFLLYLLFSKLFVLLNSIEFRRISRVIIFLVLFFLLFNFMRSGITFDSQHEFQLETAKLADNVFASVRTANAIASIKIDSLIKISNFYNEYKLKTKPDIYFIFFESYGKIVYQDSAYTEKYMAVNQKCEKKLKDNGYYIRSVFSISPVSGGKSWISFSTVLFGYNFKNQETFSFLFRNDKMAEYCSALRYFQRQGYRSYWITPVPENTNVKVPLKLYTEFYGIDEWIRFSDLDYHGQLYGFGPSPPDEYVLFKSRELYMHNNSPKVFFYITLNSHTPFFCPDSVASDWKNLNQKPEKLISVPKFYIKPKPVNYIKSIEYELETLTKFIIETNNKKAVYIIVGDHQPPVLTNEKSGFETPVHIISTDSSFVNNFSKYGFGNGLFLKNSRKSIRHEGIYSMLLCEINRAYGQQKKHIPKYSQNGL